MYLKTLKICRGQISLILVWKLQKTIIVLQILLHFDLVVSKLFHYQRDWEHNIRMFFSEYNACHDYRLFDIYIEISRNSK